MSELRQPVVPLLSRVGIHFVPELLGRRVYDTPDVKQRSESTFVNIHDESPACEIMGVSL